MEQKYFRKTLANVQDNLKINAHRKKYWTNLKYQYCLPRIAYTSESRIREFLKHTHFRVYSTKYPYTSKFFDNRS